MTDHTQYEVRDGDRVLRFTGVLLAESTSRKGDTPRWIEFKLYRTAGGTYILSRIGQTVIFHAAHCELVPQYRLKPGVVDPTWTACEECLPEPEDDRHYPERIRYWAQPIHKPDGVVEALMKYDLSGARYLTYVAQRLLSQAAEVDESIASAYHVEVVA